MALWLCLLIHLTKDTMVSYASVSCWDISNSALSRFGGGMVSSSFFVCRIITLTRSAETKEEENKKKTENEKKKKVAVMTGR